MTSDGTSLQHTVLDNLATFLSVDKLKELLARYLADSQQILIRLDAALSEQNTAEASRLVHSLISISAHVGALQISELAKSLEDLAQEEKFDDIRAQMSNLSQLFDRTRGDIEQLDFMQG